MSRLSRRSMASVGGAVVLALFSLSMANAESTSDYTSLSYSAPEVFAKTLRDQTAISDHNEWSDFSALGYARSRRSDDAAVRWLPPPMPAVDGINGKIDGYGGGANHTNGFYGGTGSLSVPLAQQWGAQFDGGVGSDEGIGWLGGAGHLFWRDPSIGLLGAFGSYSHWNGIDIVNFGHISTDTGHFAAEGEYYWGRWTFGGLAGVQTVHINAPVVPGVQVGSIPNRFFEAISASYYVTDNFKLLIGHLYQSGHHGLRLGAEHGFALGGGRMASLFAEALFAERGSTTVLAGLRVYFGQHDKTLIDRHRQDDPSNLFATGLPTEDGALYRLILKQLAAEIVNKAIRDEERLRRIRDEGQRLN